MKKLFAYLPLLLALHACDDLEDQPASAPEAIIYPEAGTAELYLLNEGLFNLNNSTLTRYTYASGEVTTDYFRRLNQRGLGDTANDMAIYGDKIYIVVNVSSCIEVIDFNSGISLKQIPMLTESGHSRQPRRIAFHRDKAYVCSFDGTVSRIDTLALQVEATLQAGRNPDGICVQNGKLYVSNSGGLDSDGIGVDRTVSVIDLVAFLEIKKIDVGYNPGVISADEQGNIYVVTRGAQIKAGDYRLHRISSATDEVTHTFAEPVLNFAIHDQFAYTYTYNFQTEQSTFNVLNLQTGETERPLPIASQLTTPYGICVNPYSGNLYLTDACNYSVNGDLLCFSPEGALLFRLNNVGLNPHTILFSDRFSHSNPAGEGDAGSSAFANKVWEYLPAPGQFVNTPTTAYQEGYTAAQVLAYATERLQKKSLLSLGGFGGSIVVGFAKSIPNVKGKADFKLYGNAYYATTASVGRLGGSSEPGIVLVSRDDNQNGRPDDAWYELAGSEYHSAQVMRGYEITYRRPSPPSGDVPWRDNQGGEGFIRRNSAHLQSSYYPAWMGSEITLRGDRLPDNAVDEGQNGAEHWVGYCYAWGYADNHPSNTALADFDIDWAVDGAGHPVELDRIDFVKIYCAVNQNIGWMGEISTEIQTIENLHKE